MPYSQIDRMMWEDNWFMTLPARTRMLYIWAWSNPRVNVACCYKVRLDPMARDNCYEDEHDPEFIQALSDLSEHMTYFEESGILWVHGFIHHQTGSKDYLRGVSKCLAKEVPSEIATRVVAYNKGKGISLEYDEMVCTAGRTVVTPSQDGVTPQVTRTRTREEQEKKREENKTESIAPDKSDAVIPANSSPDNSTPPPDITPRCGWCVNPKTNGANPLHKLMQYLHDSYLREKKICLVIHGGKDGASLNKLIKAGKAEEYIGEVWDFYLNDQNGFYKQRGWSVDVFCQSFNALELKMEQRRKEEEYYEA